ncbi:MAG: hypothetical protein R3C11_01575 [Planctomycetaceae bacterium]
MFFDISAIRYRIKQLAAEKRCGTPWNRKGGSQAHNGQRLSTIQNQLRLSK